MAERKRKRKDPAAVALGRKRMRALSKDQRVALAKMAGAKGVKARFAGMTEEQVSAEMRRVRAAAKKRPG